MPTQAFLHCKAEPIITMLKVCPNIPEKPGAIFLTFQYSLTKLSLFISKGQRDQAGRKEDVLVNFKKAYPKGGFSCNI